VVVVGDFVFVEDINLVRWREISMGTFAMIDHRTRGAHFGTRL